MIIENLFYPRPSQTNRIIKLVSSAMQNDPLNIYLFPDQERRKSLLPFIYQVVIRYGIQNKLLYATSEKLEGVALWFPSVANEMPFLPAVRYGGLSVLTKTGIKEIMRMIRYQQHCVTLRKKYAHFPYWYLVLIAIDPQFQGKGLATQLIKPILQQADSENKHCYLETQNENNISIYNHFGFEVVAESTIPSTGEHHWCLLRKPRR